MRVRQVYHPLRYAAVAFLLAALHSCGSETPYDWKNRELPWTYGPTSGTAKPEHLAGTGTIGDGAIAKGWKCRLSDGRHLTVKPMYLEKSHALFGKVSMIVGLFDKSGKQLEIVRSGTITAENATLSVEIAEAVAKPVYDVVIWFGAA